MTPVNKVLVNTLGCKVNQCESAMLMSRFVKTGWRLCQNGETADLVIINTCTVTQKAAMQSRQLVRQMRRRHPNARVIVTGCHATVNPLDMEQIPGIHAVVDNQHKDDILKHAVAPEPKPLNQPFEDNRDAPDVMPVSGRTRPALKIQDGCNARCTYCIIPKARGDSKSCLAPEQVVQTVRAMAASGAHEVVLCGIHLGAYGRDLTPATSLTALLTTLDPQAVIRRVRLSSIEPRDLPKALIRLVADSDMICPHFHIPLQSGSDRILGKMGRPYTSAFYRNLIYDITDTLPEVAIGADVITGFPCESETDFEKTATLIESLPLAYLHVFPFSDRKGTQAAKMSHQIPAHITKERASHLRALGRRKKHAFSTAQIGKTVAVLVEGPDLRAASHVQGFTPNYLKVSFRAKKTALTNRITRVSITDLTSDLVLTGEEQPDK